MLSFLDLRLTAILVALAGSLAAFVVACASLDGGGYRFSQGYAGLGRIVDVVGSRIT